MCLRVFVCLPEGQAAWRQQVKGKKTNIRCDLDPFAINMKHYTSSLFSWHLCQCVNSPQFQVDCSIPLFEHDLYLLAALVLTLRQDFCGSVQISVKWPILRWIEPSSTTAHNVQSDKNNVGSLIGNLKLLPHFIVCFFGYNTVAWNSEWLAHRNGPRTKKIYSFV